MTSLIPNSPDRDNIRTLSKILLAAFLLVAASLFFWSIFRASSILARDDNPRLVEAELSIQRGTIFDRSGTILAQSIGPQERKQRLYPFPEIGPAVGYYSLTYGTTGVENGFDSILRGDSNDPAKAYWQQVLHLPQEGLDVQLALDAGLQETSHSLLSSRDGAVLLLEIPHEESSRAWIRVLSSKPGYNPNTIDEQFEELGSNERAPLLNRVTQGQYQPGLLLQPLILASAVDQGILNLQDPVTDPRRPVRINGMITQCASPPPDPAAWADILLHQCPAPMQDLADQLGRGGLDAIFATFGLDRDPELEIDTTTTPDQPIADSLLAGIGQDNLSITPLKIGLAMSALASQGFLPQPQLAAAVLDDEGSWQEQIQGPKTIPAASAKTARDIRQALPLQDDIREFSTLVISGPDELSNAWYVGMSEAETADHVVVVVLEGRDEKSTAQRIGRELMAASK